MVVAYAKAHLFTFREVKKSKILLIFTSFLYLCTQLHIIYNTKIKMKTIYEFAVKDRKGKDVSLKEYANEVLLIVNTATKCGGQKR